MICKIPVVGSKNTEELMAGRTSNFITLPPDIMDCLWACAPGCRSSIEGDGELSTAFGIIADK